MKESEAFQELVKVEDSMSFADASQLHGVIKRCKVSLLERPWREFCKAHEHLPVRHTQKPF